MLFRSTKCGEISGPVYIIQINPFPSRDRFINSESNFQSLSISQISSLNMIYIVLKVIFIAINNSENTEKLNRKGKNDLNYPKIIMTSYILTISLLVLFHSS